MKVYKRLFVCDGWACLSLDLSLKTTNKYKKTSKREIKDRKIILYRANTLENKTSQTSCLQKKYTYTREPHVNKSDIMLMQSDTLSH